VDFTHFKQIVRQWRKYFQALGERMNGVIIADYHAAEEPSPMWIHERETDVRWNWTAILSYTASVAVSLAIWKGLFLAVGRLVK
jgi:hypothetical protein